MATKKRREEKAQEEAKSQKKESLIQGGLVLIEKVFEPLKAMLDAYDATNQTNEERFRAYQNHELETKTLEIFQKMIEGTQALLNKQLDKQRSFEDHMKPQIERGKVPFGPRNLVSSDGANTEGPHKSKKKQRRTSTKSKLAMPPPLEVLEPSPTL